MECCALVMKFNSIPGTDWSLTIHNQISSNSDQLLVNKLGSIKFMEIGCHSVKFNEISIQSISMRCISQLGRNFKHHDAQSLKHYTFLGSCAWVIVLAPGDCWCLWCFLHAGTRSPHTAPKERPTEVNMQKRPRVFVWLVVSSEVLGSLRRS